MRLQFEVTDKENSELILLKKQLGLSTKKALFENAISLIQWAVRQRRQGRTIVSIAGDKVDLINTGDNTKELVMPMLDHVAWKGEDYQNNVQT